MRKMLISVSALAALIALGACTSEIPENQQVLEYLTEEDGPREARYRQENSPVLNVLPNGYVTVRCPPGYRFQTSVRHTGGGAPYQSARCAPNAPPADEETEEQPDPTRSADGRDG